MVPLSLYEQYCNQLRTLCENNIFSYNRLFQVINNPDLCDLLLDPTNEVLVLLQNSGISKRRLKKYNLICRVKNNPSYFEICDIIHNIKKERKQITPLITNMVPLSLYEQYCNQLRTLCENNIFSYNRLFQVINNPDLCDLLLDPTNEVLVLLQNSGISKRRLKKYNLICRVKNNPSYFEICDIIHNIKEERKQIAKRSTLYDLPTLNDSLIKLGEELCPSITQARKKLKTIYINIYDYDAGKYDKRTDLISLRLDLNKNEDRHYPLYDAKSDRELTPLLQHSC